MSKEMLDQMKGAVARPDIEIFKIGPEVIEDFISKVLVLMGGEPADIQNIIIGDDRKRLQITAVVEKDSDIFNHEEDVTGGLSLLGRPSDDLSLTDRAKKVMRDFGYFYTKVDEDDDEQDVYLVRVTENKKNVELEFDQDVTMAIITDTDFTDEHFVVDAAEEVLRKKKHNRKKFKGKKKTIVFAKVTRTHSTESTFEPEQVGAFHSGEQWDDDEYDDEDED